MAELEKFPVFFAVSRELWFSADPESNPREPPRSRLSEAGHARKTRIMLAAAHALPRTYPGIDPRVRGRRRPAFVIALCVSLD